jgi:hypothetical protein
MKLQCLNGIITKNLAIDIDLSNLNSWNLNSEFTATSLVNYKDRITSDSDLLDFGLTGFDNGRTDRLNDDIVLSTNDKFTLYRIGYNNPINSLSGQTSGYSSTVNYNIFPITGVTTGLTGNYFNLNGGYLQGFFKLPDDFNYELFPSRYNNGITIETLLNVNINTEGIFYLMGLRAEDKYNQSFTGETTLTSSVKKIFGNNTGTIYNTGATSNILTSFDNVLAAIDPTITPNDVFKDFSDSRTVIDVIPNQIDNLKNNIIAFEITNDKRLGYRYINSNGLFESNVSTNKLNNLGWNIIDIVFQPYTMIDNYDRTIQNCYDLRKGILIFYVNGRKFWEVQNFEEFYFRSIDNNKEKQIGVPYNISWGGGSFGLKYSYHYDYHNYSLYYDDNMTYINNKFHVEYDPDINKCIFTGNTKQYQSGLILSANTTSFIDYDKCDNSIPLTVLDISYSGVTTGQTKTDYFIRFNQPIVVRPNIEYDISLMFNDTGIFSNTGFDNEISLLISGNTNNNIEIIENIKYLNNPSDPTHNPSILVLNQAFGFYSDGEQSEYSNNGVLIDAITGYPVVFGAGLQNKGVGYNESPVFIYDQPNLSGIWKTLSFKFKINDYSSDKFIFYFGFIIKSSVNLIANKHLYIKDFSYLANDILVKDPTKNNLIIENKFNNSFIGGIQKLRVYDTALESNEVLNNAYWESIDNNVYAIPVSTGGRIINNNARLTQEWPNGIDLEESIDINDYLLDL